MQIKHFNRYELKYILHRAQAEVMVEELARYLNPDPHSQNGGQYSITSLYYDTADYKAYWDKIEGHKIRRKVRIRVYGDELVTSDTVCFAEIKHRIDKTLQKRRIELPYAAAFDLCGAAKRPETVDAEDDMVVVRELQYLSGALQLKPACIVCYDRLAFNGPEYDVGLRVTFDTNLKYHARNLTLAGHNFADKFYFMPPEYTIMEIKVNNRVPYWLTEFIGKYRCTLQRVSKYCTALEKAKLLLKEQKVIS